MSPSIVDIVTNMIPNTDWKGRPYYKFRTAPKIAFEIAKRFGKNVTYVAEATTVEELREKRGAGAAVTVALVA